MMVSPSRRKRICFEWTDDADDDAREGKLTAEPAQRAEQTDRLGEHLRSVFGDDSDHDVGSPRDASISFARSWRGGERTVPTKCGPRICHSSTSSGPRSWRG